MTEQLFVGAIHEHGNLLRVNVIDSKMTEIIKLSLPVPIVRTTSSSLINFQESQILKLHIVTTVLYGSSLYTAQNSQAVY